MEIRYLPCLQSVQNSRSYVLLLPDSAPFEETQQACADLISQVEQIKKSREEAKLKLESENQMSEAQAQEPSSN